MKKLSLLLVAFFLVTFVNAQEETATPTTEETKAWTRAGNVSLLFNQSAFNNEWLGGGVSNLAGNLAINYDFNYKKNDLNWDNKIIAAYGLTKLDGADNFSKTDDRFELNSLAGKAAGGNWFYSMFMNFKTQMDSGFTPDGYKFSHFFSPAYLQAGPGMLWKKSDNLKVNIAPATARLIFVHDEFTAVDGQLAIDGFNAAGGYFGVEANETSRFEFGAALSGYAKYDIVKNVTMENILNLYSNYKEDPQNVDIDYTMNLIMTINKYMSANIAMQAIYDDNAIRAFQVREVFGLGLNYAF